jgi:hypothetical protein
MHDIELILRLRLTPSDPIPFYSFLLFFFTSYLFSFFSFYLLVSYSCIVLSAGSRTTSAKLLVHTDHLPLPFIHSQGGDMQGDGITTCSLLVGDANWKG